LLKAKIRFKLIKIKCYERLIMTMKKLLTALLLMLSTGLMLSTVVLAGDCADDDDPSACRAERAESRVVKDALLEEVKAGRLTVSEAAKIFRGGAPGPEPGMPDRLIESMLFDLKDAGGSSSISSMDRGDSSSISSMDRGDSSSISSMDRGGITDAEYDSMTPLDRGEITEAEYDSMTPLEQEIHDEGRELNSEERANLADFDAIEAAILEDLPGAVDATTLARAIKAKAAALGIEVKINYAKKRGLSCFSMDPVSKKITTSSCSKTPEALDDCGGSMGDDYKSGTMVCNGFSLVGTKIE